MANWVEQLDAQIAELFASWNLYTSLIAILLVAFIAYPLIFWEEPDTHPLLLARQSRPSPVRQPNESAIYRSLEAPHGYPLRSGLNVKDADAPRWTAGRDGDLRDIWRSVVRGGPEGEKGYIMSVFGKDAAVEHNLDQLSREINVVGKQLQSIGGQKVAIYMPNSIEYLLTIFACAFYGLSPVLIPYNQPHDVVIDLIKKTRVDSIVANAGSLPLVDVCSQVSGLRQVIWVVEKTSRHMDWTGPPETDRAQVSVSVWHDLMEEQKDRSSADLPPNAETKPGNLVHVWLAKQGVPAAIVEFTQQNLVSAIAALTFALPLRQRFNPSDLILPADSFSSSYVLCQTLAALFSHCSLAINSVAGPGVDLALAARSVSPTVVIASAETLSRMHEVETAGISSGLQRMAHVSQAQAMSAGRMPTDTLLFKLLGPRGGAASTAPGKLRLILVSERAGSDSPALSSTQLSDLRIFTRARLCYALTSPYVAGAVTQSNLYDYRRDDHTGHSHFGVPLSSVEVKLINKDDHAVSESSPDGEVSVVGPSVAGGEARLGIHGRIRDDGTLAYA